MSIQAESSLVQVDFPFDYNAWAAWLRQQIDSDWRIGEWDPDTWLFTANPHDHRNRLSICLVDACTQVINDYRGFCDDCRAAVKVSNLSSDEFIASHIPPQKRRFRIVWDRCMVVRNGIQCTRPARSAKRICDGHHFRWIYYRKHGDQDLSLEEWATLIAVPYADSESCLILGCVNPASNGQGLCQRDYDRWLRETAEDRKSGKADLSTQQWAENKAPYLGVGRFSLAPLTELARLEFLYALQQRDARGQLLCMVPVRSLVRRLGGVRSLLGHEPVLAAEVSGSAGPRSLWRQYSWLLRVEFDRFNGIDPSDKDIVDLRLIGLKSANKTGPRVNHGSADLTPLTQTWLRSLFKEWQQSTEPTTSRYTRMLRAAKIAAQALAARPGGGADQTVLNLIDMDAVVDAFRVAVTLEDGKSMTGKYRCDLLTAFCQLLDFGRRAELLNDLPGTFARNRLIPSGASSRAIQASGMSGR